MKPKIQRCQFQNPWPWWFQINLMLWRLTWLFTCSWTPKFLNPWRLCILKLFGATLSGKPFVHSKAIIEIPWNLKMEHRACLGEKVNAYSLGKIEIHEGATIAQQSFLCTGTHDYNSPTLQLLTQTITIKRNSFIGARAMILPGVTVEQNAVIGAMSVVTKNVNENTIVAGNPAQKIGERFKK